MDAVKLIGETVKATAEITKENDSIGCAKFVVFCNAPDDNPFMAGAFHGVSEADAIINAAQVQTEELINEHEIMQRAYAQANDLIEQATAQAQAILDNATEEANSIRYGAMQYTDDMLAKLQGMQHIRLTIDESNPEGEDIDQKLVKLAQARRAALVTNDYNLSKIGKMQNIAVLNVNDLSNAVKPVMLPGEELDLQIVKEGKEHGQGVAYLDDGTMIVVEGGKRYVAQCIRCVVTSVLQTSAGRMIFAKIKEEQ